MNPPPTELLQHPPSRLYQLTAVSAIFVPSGTWLPNASRMLVTVTVIGRFTPSAITEDCPGVIVALLTPPSAILRFASGLLPVMLLLPSAGMTDTTAFV